MSRNENNEMKIEILTTVEALKKNPADYDMVFAVEDYITGGVYSPAAEDEERVSLVRVDHVGDGKKGKRDDLAVRTVKGVRETSLKLLSVWAVVSDSRNIMIHCKNGGSTTTPRDRTAHWATVRRLPKPSFRWTADRSCTNNQWTS